MLVGLLHPTIYLPQLDFTEGELYAILAHEYFHYKNKDILLMIVTNLTCIIFWWNPLVYVLRKNVNMALELNNDFFAITTMPNTTLANYLKSILKIADKPAGASLTNAVPSTNAASFIKSQDEMAERVDAMLLYQKPQKKQALISAIFCVCMLFCFCISYVFILQSQGGIEKAKALLSQEEGSENVVFGDPPYLIINEDGTYSLYMNNEFAGIYEKGDDFIKDFPVKK